jgi:hypothetical protein
LSWVLVLSMEPRQQVAFFLVPARQSECWLQQVGQEYLPVVVAQMVLKRPCLG